MKLAEEIEYLKTLISEYGETIDGLQEEIAFFRNKENLMKDEQQPPYNFKKNEIVMVKQSSWHCSTPRRFIRMTEKGLVLCTNLPAILPYSENAWLYARKQNAKEKGE